MRERLARLGRRVVLGLLHLHQGIYAVSDGRVGQRLLHSGGRYDRYQARTSRPIPVVRLTPV